MSYITVTKKQIIKAIQDETKLVSGMVFDDSIASENSLEEFNQEHDSEASCGVCAVGAVLRNYLPPEMPMWQAHATSFGLGPLIPKRSNGNGRKRFAKLLVSGVNPLAVLSRYFELTYDQSLDRIEQHKTLTGVEEDLYYRTKAIERTRRMTCAFVRDCFPDTVTFEVCDDE